MKCGCLCAMIMVPNGREIKWETTVLEERKNNIHVKEGTSESEFVEMRSTRDKTLSVPKLIIPSVQVNMQAGRLPEPEENGMSYLKIPLNALCAPDS